MRVVIFGRQSVLASYLLKITAGTSERHVYRVRDDVTRPALFDLRHNVDVVVNCAAVTEAFYGNLGYGRHGWAGIYEERPAKFTAGRGVALEKTASRLYMVNGIGAGNVALWAKAREAYLIHVSCASVMGADGPYYDTQRPNPQDMLGYTKRAGELNVEAVMGSDPYTIIRFGALYGARYQGCPPVAAASRKEPAIDDMVKVMPIHGEQAAHKINILINQWGLGLPELGIVHVGSPTSPQTWYEFLEPYYPNIEPGRERGKAPLKETYGLVASSRDFTAGWGLPEFEKEVSERSLWGTTKR